MHLDELYVGPEFDIALMTSKVLTFVCLTLVYCGALPLLIPVLTIYLSLKYWIDKY